MPATLEEAFKGSVDKEKRGTLFSGSYIWYPTGNTYNRDLVQNKMQAL